MSNTRPVPSPPVRKTWVGDDGKTYTKAVDVFVGQIVVTRTPKGKPPVTEKVKTVERCKTAPGNLHITPEVSFPWCIHREAEVEL